ncbi:hypothetical protein IAU60_006831 [Kwoniella sp. DSM 27419]
MITAFTLSLFASLVAGVTAGGQTFTNSRATVYYDLSGACGNTAMDVAGSQEGPRWADGGYNKGYTACEPSPGAKTIAERGYNGIVALSSSVFDHSMCGKEIKVTQADGTPINFPSGTPFVWDICPGCEPNHIDISGVSLVDINGGNCTVNPEGFTYTIADTLIVDPTTGELTGAGSASGSTDAPTSSTPSITSSAAAETDSSSASAPTELSATSTADSATSDAAPTVSPSESATATASVSEAAFDSASTSTDSVAEPTGTSSVTLSSALTGPVHGSPTAPTTSHHHSVHSTAIATGAASCKKNRKRRLSGVY